MIQQQGVSGLQLVDESSGSLEGTRVEIGVDCLVNVPASPCTRDDLPRRHTSLLSIRARSLSKNVASIGVPSGDSKPSRTSARSF